MNRGRGVLMPLNTENIPSHANPHQQHILAISRNLRRYYSARILNLNATIISERRISDNLRIGLANEIVVVHNQQTNERLYQIQILMDEGVGVGL
ncbi:unnamed protein product [Rotaria sordida]|uniref:Uncharacterized protein n=1 Tax=Rotaria sordida TaxID=392033 RepID=A0A819YRP9_9BILA|nr:unnamed protein product [Rotaria sordida]CAF4158849.1 unnamed protein product [Rotaria sordida]